MILFYCKRAGNIGEKAGADAKAGNSITAATTTNTSTAP